MVSFYPNEGGEGRGEWHKKQWSRKGKRRDGAQILRRGSCSPGWRRRKLCRTLVLSATRRTSRVWRARVCRTCRRRININAQGFTATRRRGGCSSSLVGRMYVYKYVSQRREPFHGPAAFFLTKEVDAGKLGLPASCTPSSPRGLPAV